MEYTLEKPFKSSFCAVRHADDGIRVFDHFVIELARMEFGKINAVTGKAGGAVRMDLQTVLRKNTCRCGIHEFYFPSFYLCAQDRFRHGTAASISRTYK